jgi:hypothetical protein
VNISLVNPATNTGEQRRVRAVVLELALILAVIMLYRSGRMLTQDAAGDALANATRVIDFERATGIFSERSVQAWALGRPAFVEMLNRYYVIVHFPATIAFFVWAYIRHPAAYRFIRTWFVLVTLAGLAIHVGFPLAPPRMTSGFRDTLQEYGPRIYSRDPRRSISNQFAAMPSLHFGWALMLAAAFVAIKRNRKSLLILLHPAITLLAIVATGNHYWLDAMIAAVLAGMFAIVLAAWRVHRNAVAERRATDARITSTVRPEVDSTAAATPHDDGAPAVHDLQVCTTRGSP